MRGAQEAVESEGARLAFVGNGSTPQARHFAQKYAPGSAIFTDPSAYTYRAIGARSGAGSTLGGVAVNGIRAMRGGYFQTSIEGRPLQHGGVLIAMPGDLLAYAYISRVAGDHPSNDAVLDALRAAVVRPPQAPYVWQPPSHTPELPKEPAAAIPPPEAHVEPAPSMPPWPVAPDPPGPPRPPGWSLPARPSKPPRSAAG